MAAGTQTLKDTAKSWGEGVATRWGNANNFSKGFLNPTAIGAGTGMVAGGAYGGLSDNGSVLGGMAGGAMLGAGLGAGGHAAWNKYKVGSYTKAIYTPDTNTSFVGPHSGPFVGPSKGY